MKCRFGHYQVILKLRRLEGCFDDQVIAFPSSHKGGIQESDLDVLRQAIGKGADLLGGCPILKDINILLIYFPLAELE